MWSTIIALMVLLGFIYLIRTRQSGATLIPRVVGTGQYAVEVVDKRDRAEALQAICGPKMEDGVNLMMRALLTLESADRFEWQAISVSIKGHTVGYLPQANARNFRRAATCVGLGQTSVFECAAVICKGQGEGCSANGNFRIWLDLPNDNVT